MAVAVAAVALAVALALTPVAIVAARRLGVVDRPGPLKVQQAPVAYLGGVAVLGAVAAGLAVSAAASGQAPLRALWPLGGACALGLADDVRALSPRLRLVAEAAVGVGVAVTADLRSPWMGAALVATTVVLVNAVNLLDGLDALAAGTVGAAALGFAAVEPGQAHTSLALAAALLGFVAYNRPPARVYLGDAGSYLLGTALAVLAGQAAAPGRPVAHLAVVPLLVAVPVGDTVVAVARRRRAGAPLFQGDRAHTYDQLVDRGHTRAAAALACIGAQAVLAALAAGLAQAPAAVAAVGAAAALAAVATVVARLGFLDPGEARSLR